MKEYYSWHTIKETPPLKVGDEGYRGYLLFVKNDDDNNGYYAIGDYTFDSYGWFYEFHVNGECVTGVSRWTLLPPFPTEYDDIDDI